MIHFLILLFGITTLYAASTGRLEAHVRVLAMQGLILSVLGLIELDPVSNPWGFALMAVETVAFKSVFIPVFLRRVARRSETRRDVDPVLSPFHTIVVAGVFFALGFFLAGGAAASTRGINPLYFGVSVSVILISLLLIMVRRLLLSHAVGYMMLENGIFLLSLSVAREMPVLVSLGILLDVFMGVFLLGLFITRFQSDWGETRVDELVQLRESGE